MRLIVKKDFLLRGTMYLPGHVEDWDITFKEIKDGLASGKLEPVKRGKRDVEMVKAKTEDGTGKDRERTDNDKSGKAGGRKNGAETT